MKPGFFFSHYEQQQRYENNVRSLETFVDKTLSLKFEILKQRK